MWQSPSEATCYAQGKPLALVSDLEDPRSALFKDAMLARGLRSPLVLPYREVIERSEDWPARLPSDSLVRIESPGRSRAINASILNRGYLAAMDEGAVGVPPERVEQLSAVKGTLINPRQWYLGFCSILGDVEAWKPKVPGIRFVTTPDDIRTMFDKSQSHARLQEAGVNVPTGLGIPRNWEDLRSRMSQSACHRVFVKLRHGSAASGVLALETCRQQIQARTTVEIGHLDGTPLLFNSRRIRRLHDEKSIAQIVDALCAWGVHVERWVPKAGVGGRCFDLRVLVVAGSPAHVVVRLSATPITNLHLGNQRTTLDAVRGRIHDDNWERALDTCRRVAQTFSRTLQVAIDLAVSPCGRRHWVLEVNAFGDLLRGCLHESMDPYALQLAALYGPPNSAPKASPVPSPSARRSQPCETAGIRYGTTHPEVLHD